MIVEFYNRLNKNEKWIAWVILYLFAAKLTTPYILFFPIYTVIAAYVFDRSHNFFTALNEVGISLYLAGIIWGIIGLLL